MRPEVVSRIRDLLSREDLTAAVISAPESLAHVNGFVIPSQSLMRWRHAMSIVTADALGAVCVDMEASTVRERLSADVQLRTWREFGDDPMAVMSELLTDMGISQDRVGIELDFLPAGDFARLSHQLPGTTFVAIEEQLATLRQLKDETELTLMRRLAHISEQAIADSFKAVGPGATELDLASALTTSVYSQGAEQFKLMIVATGPRSQLPNVGPTARVLQSGDICRVEIFSVLAGYHAGVCRTAAVGSAPPEALRIWQTLSDCQHLLLDRLRPGASTRAIWDEFKAKFDQLGLPAISFVGHGIGVHLHERPYIGPFSDETLRAGMVLGIEPLVYDTGLGFGMQLKDIVAITEDGCELLSDVYPTDELGLIS